TFFLRLSLSRRASLPTVVVLPAPCRPAIRITAGAGTLRLRSLACAPITAVSSSRTTLISAWPGVSDLSTSCPTARTLIRSTSACTTGKATSASSSAMRTSRVASRMFSSVSRPRPRRRSMVPDRRWVSDSNMAETSWKTGPSIIAGGRRGSGAGRPPLPGGRGSCDTFPMPIVLIAAAFYLLGAWLVARRLRFDRAAGAGFWLLTAVSAVALHGLVHVLAWRAESGLDLHFFSALSLVGLGMAALTTLYAAAGRMGALGVVVFPVAALSLLGYGLSAGTVARDLDWRLELHAWLALLAY